MEYFTKNLKEEYAGLTGEPTLTAFLPYNFKDEPVKKPRPAILLCPGGGYWFVSKRESEPVVFALLTLKINVFVLNYSIEPTTYPEQIREVAAAFDLIRKNADEWHTDKDNIGIMGFSAGGHLASHYANRYACDDVKAVIENPYRPAFCVLGYPVITAIPEIRHSGSFLHLLGHEPSSEEIVEFSTNNMVSSDTPPTFIWATATDKTVPAINSILYAKALAENGVPYTLHIFPSGDHGLSTACEVTNEGRHDLTGLNAMTYTWVEELKSWLRGVAYK